MLGRSVEDEMGRITERGSQHAAAAWLRIANHAEQLEQQLHANQQARFMHDRGGRGRELAALIASFGSNDTSRNGSHQCARHTLSMMSKLPIFPELLYRM